MLALADLRVVSKSHSAHAQNVTLAEARFNPILPFFFGGRLARRSPRPDFGNGQGRLGRSVVSCRKCNTRQEHVCSVAFDKVEETACFGRA